MVPLVLPSDWRSGLGCRRSVPSPRGSGLASLTFQGSVLITKLCVIQRLSFVCPLQSLSLHIKYCKYLLGQEAGMPFCLGLAETWIPCLDKNLLWRTEGSVVGGVVQAAYLGLKGWISMDRRWPEYDFLSQVNERLGVWIHQYQYLLWFENTCWWTWEHLSLLLKRRIQ